MGCSGGQKSGLLSKNSMFSKEIYGYQTNLESKGMINISSKTLSSYIPISENFPNFFEEKMELAIEKEAVRPWLTNIVPPEHEIDENTDESKYTLRIDHVFGYRNDDSRQNLFYLTDDQIVYITGSLGIIQNIDDLSQVIFGGNTSIGKRTCHNNDIMSIALYKGPISMVATGQRSLKPFILVWSPVDPNVIYAKFHQSIGSKEVSRIAFDLRGYYVGSFGKDPENSFYIFHMESKSLYWTEKTGEGSPLLDLKFDPYQDEFCACGEKKVMFGNLKTKILTYMPNKRVQNELFTAIAYISFKDCVVGTASGKIFLFKRKTLYETYNITKGSVVVLKYNEKEGHLFLSDSLKSLFILNTYRRRYNKVKHIKFDSVVNSIDFNSEGDLLLGFKNGDIRTIHVEEGKEIEKIIARSHSYGKVMGLDFINDKQALTTGEDNKIMLWNLRTHICENVGSLDSTYTGNIASILRMRKIINQRKKKQKKKHNNEKNDEEYNFSPHQKSWAVSYNKQKGHVAIGLCNGYVSIRQSIKKLDIGVCPDIKIGDVNTQTRLDTDIENKQSETGLAITDLKYTNYGDLLAVAKENGILAILDANESYNIIKQIIIENFVTNLDWDQSNKYIQIVTADNRYMFIEYSTGLIKRAINLRSVEWPNQTCKFGYNVQGVYMGLTDPEFITCVCKAHTRNIIVSGDDHMNINLYNYPAISENTIAKSYCGHSENIVRICFSNDDTRLMTIAGDDQSVILWSVNMD